MTFRQFSRILTLLSSDLLRSDRKHWIYGPGEERRATLVKEMTKIIRVAEILGLKHIHLENSTKRENYVESGFRTYRRSRFLDNGKHYVRLPPLTSYYLG